MALNGFGIYGGLDQLGLIKAGWSDIAIPDAVFSWLPFSLEKNGGVVRVKGSFDLQVHAGITVTKAYYVKPAALGGSDSNSGADWDHALAKVKTAAGKADCDRINVWTGTYVKADGWDNTSPARSMEIIAYGGPVIFSMHAVDLVWSAVGNHYEATYATNIGSVVDFKNPDVYSEGIPLVYKTSSTDVDTYVGTWFYGSGKIYVHTLDGRTPDSNIFCYIASASGRQNDAVTYYFEGIQFHGGTSPFLAGIANVGAKLYAKDCYFRYGSNSSAVDAFTVTGLGEVILQNCVASRNGGDGFKFQVSSSITANVVLVDCVGRNNGAVTSTNSNGYSRHGPGYTVAINCQFYGNYGPNMKDITDGTKTWMLGCDCHNPAAASQGYNFAMGNDTTLWLDCCISSGAQVSDLVTDNVTTEIYYRNMTPAVPTHTGIGTAAAY